MEDLTLIDGLRRQLAERPDATAYRQGERRLSYRDIEAFTNRLAHALAGAGVARGSRVAVLTKQHVECILVTLAACKLGAVCMPVNWRLAAKEVEYIVNNGEAPFLMADTEFLPLLEKAELPGVRIRVCTTEGTALPSLAQWCAGQSDRFEPVAADTHDAALQLYSSGTTDFLADCQA
ncbi:MAG: AMP-binding protein, partial [Gammaproteobacteria bacterium]